MTVATAAARQNLAAFDTFPPSPRQAPAKTSLTLCASTRTPMWPRWTGAAPPAQAGHPHRRPGAPLEPIRRLQGDPRGHIGRFRTMAERPSGPRGLDRDRASSRPRKSAASKVTGNAQLVNRLRHSRGARGVRYRRPDRRPRPAQRPWRHDRTRTRHALSQVQFSQGNPMGASAIPPPVTIGPGEWFRSLATGPLPVTDDGVWPREKDAPTATALPPDEVRRPSIRLANLQHFAFAVWQDCRMPPNHYPISNLCTHGAHSLCPSRTASLNRSLPACKRTKVPSCSQPARRPRRGLLDSRPKTASHSPATSSSTFRVTISSAAACWAASQPAMARGARAAPSCCWPARCIIWLR